MALHGIVEIEGSRRLDEVVEVRKSLGFKEVAREDGAVMTGYHGPAFTRITFQFFGSLSPEVKTQDMTIPREMIPAVIAFLQGNQ